MADDHLWGSCFTIMPFGKKQGPLHLAGPSQPPTTVEIDFDMIFSRLIRSALDKVGLEAKRTKESDVRGLISSVIYLPLKNEDYALIDATFLNPNAFYELGVRHAYRDRTTIAIAATGTIIPFDVHDVHFFLYDVDEKGQLRDVDASVEGLREHCSRALKARIDSPVLQAIGEDRRGSRKMPDGRRFDFAVAQAGGARLGVVTGDLRELSDIHAWVNSENNYLEPARIPERSISSTIRHLAAEYKNDKIHCDWVMTYLTKKLKGRDPPFDVGTVVITPPGQLKKRGVRRIVHIVSVTGSPGGGFKAHDDLGRIVDTALVRIAEFNDRFYCPGGKLRSVVLPAFGTGQGQARIEVASDILIGSAISSLRKIWGQFGTRARLEQIFFLAYDERAVRAFHRSMGEFQKDGRLMDRKGDSLQDILKTT
jgi:O-acetyl-ADP-ribose deacetylase (regulator of RNase III)